MSYHITILITHYKKNNINELKELNIKNRTRYCFGNALDINETNLNNNLLDEES